MGLIWLTGISGAGKSTVVRELRRRGYSSFDADDDGICVWRERATGAIIDPDVERTVVLAHKAWCIERHRVEELAELARNRSVFIGGTVENELDVWDLFDHVVCLVADDATVRRRLADRTNNDFGKHPDELRMILQWNQTVEATYRSFGATIVDATKPLARVGDDVLTVTAATLG